MRNHGLGSWIARRARMGPERLALLHEDHEWTYAELSTAISRSASVLSRLGVRPRDRVGYLGPNHPACPRRSSPPACSEPSSCRSTTDSPLQTSSTS
jgi:acyl-CoA synthetase (AMP-forming)/AMP-acid ligase II